MSKGGNGDNIPKATESRLLRILGRAHSERKVQAEFKRQRDAIERSRQARVRAQRGRKDGKKK